MLLALDAGNTNITIGAFEGERLTGRWRLRTIREQTADEWGVLMRNLFSLSSLDLTQVDGIIIASVVPPIDATLAEMARRYFHTDPLFITPETDLGIKVLYDNPREVGADRVINGVAAYSRYGGPCVVVDLGTTINFDVVSANAEYLGGMICPGIGMSISGLFSRTARLPMVDFREPPQLIGKNTVHSIQSGLYYGFAGLIDGILDRIAAELGPATKMVATGGQAHMIALGVAPSQGSQRGSHPGRTPDCMGSQPGAIKLLQLLHRSRRPFPHRARHRSVPDVSLDWALVETWKDAGVPLEAVLRGIDAAFEKWRTKKHRIQKVNGLAWCTQPVLLEAQTMAGVAQSRPASRPKRRSAWMS